MPEPISTQLPADANPVPVSSLEDFLVRAKADPVPENMPETTLQVHLYFYLYKGEFLRYLDRNS